VKNKKMQCNKCNEFVTIKDTNEYLSIKCDCKILIIYPDGFIVRKEKKDFIPNYKEKEKQK
jgi:phage FluMu protein Com